jgi:(p)ppGpp synthase/HD superfamily hydrolase
MIKQFEHLPAEAAAFAIRAHAGQVRTGTQFPYFVHPLGVGMMLRFAYPGEEVLEAAGYLHDVVEDTDVTDADIESRFGEPTAALVRAVTRRPDQRNYGKQLEREIVMSPLVARLKVADVIDNMRDTIRGLEKGHDVWSRFSAGRRKVKYWEGIYELAVDVLDPEPIIGNFEELLLHPIIREAIIREARHA